MLGESDLIYTQTLCRIGADDYTGKEVLILGGGDGGILHELLKENPAYITMAEVKIIGHVTWWPLLLTWFNLNPSMDK